MCPRLKLSAGTERLYNARHRCCGSKSCATENRFRNSRFAPCESHGPGEHVRLVRQKHTRCCNVLCATARLPASTWTYTSSIIAVHPVTMHSRESDSAAGLKPQITGERPFELIYKRGCSTSRDDIVRPTGRTVPSQSGTACPPNCPLTDACDSFLESLPNFRAPALLSILRMAEGAASFLL